MTLGTLVAGIIVAGVVFLAARSLRKDKKNGSPCAGCSGCAGAHQESACHCEAQKDDR